MNKVYLIKAKHNPSIFGWDCNLGMVVVAKDSRNARQLAYRAAEFGGEPRESWLDPKLTTCKSIPLDKEQVLMIDYHAG